MPQLKKGPRWGPFIIWCARKDEDSDLGLLDILEKRIVHALPLLSSPAAALRDIETLAEERATVSDEDNHGERNLH